MNIPSSAEQHVATAPYETWKHAPTFSVDFSGDTAKFSARRIIEPTSRYHTQSKALLPFGDPNGQERTSHSKPSHNPQIQTNGHVGVSIHQDQDLQSKLAATLPWDSIEGSQGMHDVPQPHPVESLLAGLYTAFLGAQASSENMQPALCDIEIKNVYALQIFLDTTHSTRSAFPGPATADCIPSGPPVYLPPTSSWPVQGPYCHRNSQGSSANEQDGTYLSHCGIGTQVNPSNITGYPTYQLTRHDTARRTYREVRPKKTTEPNHTSAPSTGGTPNTQVKRSGGRPRKHPLPSKESSKFDLDMLSVKRNRGYKKQRTRWTEAAKAWGTTVSHSAETSVQQLELPESQLSIIDLEFREMEESRGSPS